jgi:hypothetical protein
MKTSVKVALGMAMIWIILALVIYLAGYSREAFGMGIMINMLCLLVSVCLALFFTKREQKYSAGIFLEDFKVALQGGVVYAIVVSAFVYIYHEYIDSGIKDSLIENQVNMLHERYADKSAYEELQRQDPTWKDKTYDDFIENQEIQFESVYTSFSVFVFHLALLFIFSMFFAFFGTLIMRKVILRI